MEEEGDLEGLMTLPQVTCFEKSSGPGGVWRSDRQFGNGGDDDVTVTESNSESGESFDENSDTGSRVHGNSRGNMIDRSDEVFVTPSKGEKSSINVDDSASPSKTSEPPSTNMYEGLWINGMKEGMEFFDYTYDDHFHAPQPVFLRRKDVLEYFMARVTKHENIFQHVEFNTSVKSVVYDDSMEKFVIETESDFGETVAQYTFDKCIWSAGLNGKPKIIKDISDELTDFNGTIVHSSDMNALAENDEDHEGVKGKTILMVGDSYSAEDLALQCIKLGAEKIYITSRKASGSAIYMGAWPQEKVEILKYCTPYGVKDDGTNSTILCEGLWPEEGYGDREVENVSIVIFCTGYEPNMEMLDPSLRPYDKNYEVDGAEYFSMPSDWKMRDNCVTHLVGHVEPASDLELSSSYTQEKVYQRMLIDNPNMFFLGESTQYPLLEIDIGANMCMKRILGDEGFDTVPSKEEMKEKNKSYILELMHCVCNRYHHDANYKEAVNKLYDGDDALPKDHWIHDQLSDEYRQWCVESADYEMRILARDAADTKYPLNLGTMEKLNETGIELLHMTISDFYNHVNLRGSSMEEREWKTFRDADPSPFKSLFTGTQAVPLEDKWLQIKDEENEEVNVDESSCKDDFNRRATTKCIGVMSS